MANPQDENIRYIKDRVKIYEYSTNSLRDKIEKAFENVLLEGFELEINLLYSGITIESPLMEQFIEEIKSHEQPIVISSLNNQIANALHEHATKFYRTLKKRFYKLKSHLSLDYKKIHRDRLPVYKVKLTLSSPEKFSVKLIHTLISEFNLNETGYCEDFRCIIIKRNPETNERKILLHEAIERIQISNKASILTLSKAEEIFTFLCHPVIFQAIKNWVFADDYTRVEITYDQLKENTKVQKLRKIEMPDGSYKRLHDVLTLLTTLEEWTEHVRRNKICAIYTSVRGSRAQISTNRVVRCLIDLDMSSLMGKITNSSILWTFTVNFARALNDTLEHFRLPRALCNFSGSRGIHLILTLEEGCLDNEYNYTDIPQVFQLPAQGLLIRNTSSVLHNKFSFIRTLLQAIILYTIHNLEHDVIPIQIRKALLPVSNQEVFKLSVHSDNTVALLCDTSSNNSGVHRIMSFHLSTGKVCRPLTDPTTGRIAKEFEEHLHVLEASDSEFILNDIEAGNSSMYLQTPPVISRRHIESLLDLKTKLLPIFSVITRFGARWVMDRNFYSFGFWMRFYSDKLSHAYISELMSKLDIEDNQMEV